MRWHKTALQLLNSDVIVCCVLQEVVDHLHLNNKVNIQIRGLTPQLQKPKEGNNRTQTYNMLQVHTQIATLESD